MLFSDEFVEQVVEVFLETQGKTAGIDYASIIVVFPVLTTESNADIATWLMPAVRHGLYSRDEARAQLGLRGLAVPIEELDFIDPSAKYLQEMALQQAESSELEEPKKRNGSDSDNN